MISFVGDLYLVPFSVLKGASSTECLQDRFNLRVVPSLRALNTNRYWEQRATSNSGMVPAVVVANPELPASVTERWGWGALPNAEQVSSVDKHTCVSIPPNVLIGCRMFFPNDGFSFKHGLYFLLM